MPYSSRACFITPSLFQLHNVQHHTPAAPFLSIADNIAAVYQKKIIKQNIWLLQSERVMDKQNEHQLIERIVGNRIETNKRELGIDSLLPL